ncbi:MAG: ParB N-terminal domain-containing protein [Fibrobacter sp.]|nr:ParB N-terminal domain-containing protein [Fibrobacter sp.]
MPKEQPKIDYKELQELMLLQPQLMPIKDIAPNNGQIPEVPKNPRLIHNEKFRKLKESITNDPEFMAVRELMVYFYDGKYITIGGNMRYHACRELQKEAVPCKILPEDTPKEKLIKWALLDNASFGDWDWEALANEWDKGLLDSCCIDLPEVGEVEPEEEAKEDGFDVKAAARKEAVSKLGDIYKLGNHRLICGDSTKQETIAILMGADQADCIITDPPYNVNYEGSNGKKIENDNMADAAFQDFLTDAFNAANNHLKPGGVFYIWHADSEGYNFRTAAKRVGWKVRQCLIWRKNSLVLGRQDYQWIHEPCQPAGTMVLTTEGEKPIELLTENDRVVSFDSLSGQVKGYRNGGYAIKTASREYSGNIYSVKVGDKTTKTTDNHQFSVRFNNDAKNKYCTYLMKRGNWWRVGISRTYDARQFGLKTRFHNEQAEAAWIISIHEDNTEAQIMEQIITCKYGIPYTIWETNAMSRKMKRSQKQVEEIYSKLNLQEMEKNANRLLEDFGRSSKYPLLTKETARQKFSRRVTAKINACNLLPGIMQLPIPKKNEHGEQNFEWNDIDSVTYTNEVCRVYSLAVDKYEHYIADGIITHNCLYGWKDGAGHYFIGRRDLTTIQETAEELDIEKLTKQEMKDLIQKMLNIPTTIMDEKKPSKSEDHPTMKPIPLIGRQVKNSTLPGQLVLDMFGGSGTTLIACEQLGRRCASVEFDPVYCDVIVRRWEELTGCQAEYLGNFMNEKEKEE